jgi:hypothetical protein
MNYSNITDGGLSIGSFFGNISYEDSREFAYSNLDCDIDIYKKIGTHVKIADHLDEAVELSNQFDDILAPDVQILRNKNDILDLWSLQASVYTDNGFTKHKKPEVLAGGTHVLTDIYDKHSAHIAMFDDKGDIVAGNRLIMNSSDGLPIDNICNKECDGIMDSYAKPAEFSKFVSISDNPKNVLKLLRGNSEFAYCESNIENVFAFVMDHHVKLHKRVLGDDLRLLKDQVSSPSGKDGLFSVVVGYFKNPEVVDKY